MRPSDRHKGKKLNNVLVIGAGAVGSIFSAYLTRRGKNVFLVDIQKDRIAAIQDQGITIVEPRARFSVRLNDASCSLSDAKKFRAEIIAVAVKTYDLEAVLEELSSVFIPGQKILVLQNGVDNEEEVGKKFGRENVLRGVINFGGMVLKPGLVQLSFFNPPNYIGVLTPENEPLARDIAGIITAAGLKTVFTPEIKKYEWIKTILAAGLMPVCAVTGLSMKEALENAETRFLCEHILQECIKVAEKEGYDLEKDFFGECLFYLSQGGHHKPSTSIDLEKGNPVEYVFQQVIDYGHKLSVSTPYLEALTMIMRTLEKRRQKRI